MYYNQKGFLSNLSRPSLLFSLVWKSLSRLSSGDWNLHGSESRNRRRLGPHRGRRGAGAEREGFGGAVQRGAGGGAGQDSMENFTFTIK